MRKLLAAAATATLAVGLAATSTAQAAPRPAPTAAVTSSDYTPPPIAWHACDNPTLQHFGAQCGMLVVPEDYAHPNGKKIKLAVSRVLHDGSQPYQGIMLTNPGGPGGSGLIYSILGAFVPNNAGAAFDWIGFDPRGVGSSVPALACDPQYQGGPRPPYIPTNNTILNQWLDKSAGYAAACKAAPNAGLFRHVHTTDNVEDMESIRKALGQEKINYYGFSYGTYLGEVYATLHPDRVGRFVFDGVIDPQRVFYQSNLDQDVAFQTTFNKYMAYLAKYDSTFHLGDTTSKVRNAYWRTVHQLDRHPVGPLGGDEFTDVITNAAYYVYNWVDIGNAFSAYVNGGDASGLLAFYGDPTGPGSDNELAVYLGTQCSDAPWPKDLTTVLDDNREYNKSYPFLTWSNGWFNGPCNYWPFPASTPTTVDGSAVSGHILMIEETYDPATPFAGALVARSLFPTASMIEGVGGTTHAGSLSGVACTDDTIANYLLTGDVPARQPGNQSDKKCPPVPAPVPGAAAPAARTASGAATLALRASLAPGRP